MAPPLQLRLSHDTTLVDSGGITAGHLCMKGGDRMCLKQRQPVVHKAPAWVWRVMYFVSFIMPFGFCLN
jgi:hypothetical protein